jgi:hypothetical protein
MSVSVKKHSRKIYEMTRITRVEVITDTGRDYVSWEDDNDITWHQDGGRTLKVFVNKVKPKTGEEGEALEKHLKNGWDQNHHKNPNSHK